MALYYAHYLAQYKLSKVQTSVILHTTHILWLIIC